MLHAHLPAFLCKHMAFRQVSEELEDVAQAWSTLGIDAGVADLVAEVNPFFEGGQLLVNARLEGDPAVIDKVSAVIIYVFRWRKFCDTR